MSKNISIAEGGTGKQMTVDKLKTNLAAGGTCLWVPEDEVSVTTKHITENGTYPASEDGKYGYSQVTVNVPGGAGGPPGEAGSSIVGTDPTDGEEYVESIDENGNIVKTLMPSGIQVTTPPTKTAYDDGETIDFSGIVVKLKKHDGTVYTDENYPDGVIPFSELTFPVTVADFDEGEADSWRYLGVTLYPGNQMWRHPGSPDDGYLLPGRDEGVYGLFFWQHDDTPQAQTLIMCALFSHNRFYASYTYGIGGSSFWSTELFSGLQWTADNLSGGEGVTTSNPIISRAEWDAFYAALIQAQNFDPVPVVASQTIPVHWTPPKPKFLSQKTRATSFDITLAQSGGTTVDDEGFSGHDGNF